MATASELYAAIIEFPNDLLPRLAFAKLIGGDRGQFMDCQIQVDHALKAGKPAVAILQADALLATGSNRQAWAALPAGARLVAYYRGCAEHVALDAAWFVANQKTLFASEPVRHIDVSGLTSDAAARDFFNAGWLGHVVGLGLEKGTARAAVSHLIACKHLVALQYLWLPQDLFTGEDLANILQAHPTIEMFSSPEYDEQIESDWDGSNIEYVVPPRAKAFEQVHGEFAALHALQRNRRACRMLF